MKAISVSIYKPHYGDCSNNGISHRFQEILLLHDEGWIDVDPDNPPENLCKIVKRHLFGQDFLHIEPVERPTGCGWMAGGCLCYSSDSRFTETSQYALSLHDRQETPEHYATYD